MFVSKCVLNPCLWGGQRASCHANKDNHFLLFLFSYFLQLVRNTVGLTVSNIQACTSSSLCLCIFQRHLHWKLSNRVLTLSLRLYLTYLEWVTQNYLICFPAIGTIKYVTQSTLVLLAFICCFRNKPQCLNPQLYLQWVTLWSPILSVQMYPSGVLASCSGWKTLTLGIF